jgi:competence protein ComFC
VARLKYRNARSSLPFLTGELSALAARRPLRVVTWVPTTPARRRQRGFDQAELLARGVARRLGLPCRRLLQHEAGPPQTGLELYARRAGPTFRPVRLLAPGTGVLLVDDVVTTGATGTAAARALRSAGAASVEVVAVARTRPDRRATAGRTLLHGRVRVCG